MPLKLDNMNDNFLFFNAYARYPLIGSLLSVGRMTRPETVLKISREWTKTYKGERYLGIQAGSLEYGFLLSLLT